LKGDRIVEVVQIQEREVMTDRRVAEARGAAVVTGVATTASKKSEAVTVNPVTVTVTVKVTVTVTKSTARPPVGEGRVVAEAPAGAAVVREAGGRPGVATCPGPLTTLR